MENSSGALSQKNGQNLPSRESALNKSGRQPGRRMARFFIYCALCFALLNERFFGKCF
jgi:hypothetical protein